MLIDVKCTDSSHRNYLLHCKKTDRVSDLRVDLKKTLNGFVKLKRKYLSLKELEKINGNTKLLTLMR